MNINLPSVTVDASVLAISPNLYTRDDIYNLLDSLLDWSQLLDKSWIKVYLHREVSKFLVENGFYPLRNVLNEIFRSQGIIEFSVNDICRLTDHLLSITPSFEEHYKIEDIYYENFSSDSEILQQLRSSIIQSNLIRSIGLIAILRKYCPSIFVNHSVVFWKAPNQEINVRLQIHDIEHYRTDIPELPKPPDYLESNVVACRDFRGLIKQINPSLILINAQNDEEVNLAIQIALNQESINNDEEPNWGGLTNLKIGWKFHDSVRDCLRDQAESLAQKVLRAIVETVRFTNMSAVHRIRVAKAGGSPNLMRNSDKAQRRDIDYEFHLHYWEGENGAIELASVVYHNDFSIPK